MSLSLSVCLSVWCSQFVKFGAFKATEVKVLEGCLKGVSRVSRGCLEGVLRVSKGCLKDV